MAKKVISLNIDEEVINELDGLAKKMGVSRSTFVEMTLRTAVGGQSLTAFTRWLFAAADGKEEEDSNLVTA